jgi:aminoglycoside 2'-N-acetyltransferase I
MNDAPPQIRVLDAGEAMRHWWPRFNDLWRRTWPPNPDVAFDPDFENTMFAAVVLLDEQEKLLGVCSWIDRTITVNGAPQAIAGLAGVVVEEEFRGRGLGKLLIENAIGEAKRRGYDWGVLFCSPHRQTFYEQFGWRVLKGDITQMRFRTECGVLDDELVMALPLNEDAQAQWPQWEQARIHVGVGQW